MIAPMLSRYLGVSIGVWYVTAPFVWGYGPTFLWWHSALLGAAIIALSAAHFVSWSRTAAHGLVLVGVYSMLAPLLHGYFVHPGAFFNDLFFGVVTIGVAVALGANAMELKARARGV